MEAMASLAQVWFALDGLVAIPFALALTWSTLSTGVLPKWFGRFSILVAAVLLVGSFGSMATTPAWLTAGGSLTGLAFVALFVWTFVLSVVQLRQARTTPLQ